MGNLISITISKNLWIYRMEKFQDTNSTFHTLTVRLTTNIHIYILTETIATGESDKFSTVARSSSTLALIGAEPLLNGLISTWILCS
jgi:hypothetical protein